jgi:hypothetical protein
VPSGGAERRGYASSVGDEAEGGQLLQDAKTTSRPSLLPPLTSPALHVDTMASNIANSDSLKAYKEQALKEFDQAHSTLTKKRHECVPLPIQRRAPS